MAGTVQRAVTGLHDTLGEALLAVYLHGSAASGHQGPQSDIDLLAVAERSLTDDQRRHLLAVLLRLSGRHPAPPGGPRCLEVVIFRRADLSANPERADFTYGEWLRGQFEAGQLPHPARNPENLPMLAQAREQAIALTGPPACDLLPPISPGQVRRAMRDCLPALLDALEGDTRNVLLTLARMWHTAVGGGFLSKDAAALWAIAQLPDHHAAIMEHARLGHLGRIADEWDSRRVAARCLARNLAGHVTRLS